MRIDQLLAARNILEIHRRLRHGIQSEDMRDNFLNPNGLILNKSNRFLHILRVPAARPDDMRHVVVHIKEVDRRAEHAVHRSREEVQAAVKRQHCACLRYHIFICCHNEHIVKALPIRGQECAQL